MTTLVLDGKMLADSTDSTRKANVSNHYSHTFPVNGAQVCVFEEVNKVIFCSLL